MIKGIYTAARSLDHRIKNVDVIANNLANLGTIGYKRDIPFSEILNDYGDVNIRKLTSQLQGEIVQTANPLDLAISGEGFFGVKDKNGELEFTRDGRFKLNDEGYLVNGSDKHVLGIHGEISLEETLLEKDSVITITKNGEVKVGDKIVDQIVVMNVSDTNRMSRAGSSNFNPKNQDYFNVPEGKYAISQGFLEQANTNPIVEMEAMIQLNKDYESAQKLINALDKSLDEANSIGRV